MKPPNPPASGEEILPWARVVAAFLKSLVPVASGDIAPSQTASGTRWNFNRRSKRQRGEVVPFQVYFHGHDHDGEGEMATISAVRLIVELDSWLLKSPNPEDKQTITGLGAPFTVEMVDKVWLEITVGSSGLIEAAEIKHGEPGGEEIWPGFPDPVEYDDEDSPDRVQKKYYHLLSYFTIKDDTKGVPIEFPDGTIKRLVTTTFGANLIACRKCFENDGERVRMLEPWFAPYYVPEE